MKRKGYILFHYVDYPEYRKHDDTWKMNCDADGELCRTLKELKEKHHGHWDEKWDLPKRHKIHYFYLDLTKMKFFPLFRWKKPYKPDPNDRFKFNEETVMSDCPPNRRGIK